MSDFPTEGRPPFINRRLSLAEWKQYVAGYDFGALAPSRLVLHHTYTPTEAQWRGLTTMRGIQRFYAGKGWMAGPHLFAGPDGIWLATPMSQVGVHAGVGNGSVAQGWYSIGLEMVGRFDAVRPAGAVWNYALAVMGELSRRLRIPPRQLISFHRDYTNAKSCPGWAVTKEWVWTSVEAYLNNTAAPPLSPPDPPVIQPSDEVLLERLLEETFRQRAGSQGYNPAWSFHQYAVEQQLGAPIGPSRTLVEGGRQYDMQPFARETLYTEVPNWGDVRTLSDLLGGSIPPAGLGRRLLDETFAVGNAPFRPDWAFHQFALLRRMGPPLASGATITVDGKQYAYQVFAVDTLYNLVPNWEDVRLLSHLAGTTNASDVRLREALLTTTYRVVGQTYRPDWAFHQRARRDALGAPLSASYQILVEGRSYAIQVYALDTLFNLVPRWSEVRRMSQLFPAPSVLGGVSRSGAVEPAMTILGGSVDDEAPVAIRETPEQGALHPDRLDRSIVRSTLPSWARSPRDGRKVELVVLHALPGSPEDVLAKMAEPGSPFATHYYVTLAGTIIQVIDETEAAWHAGFGSADGLWWNLNTISLGIGLERPVDWPASLPGETTLQVAALTNLLCELSIRYQLTPDAILLWSSLAGGEPELLDGLPLVSLCEAISV